MCGDSHCRRAACIPALPSIAFSRAAGAKMQQIDSDKVGAAFSSLRHREVNKSTVVESKARQSTGERTWRAEIQVPKSGAVHNHDGNSDPAWHFLLYALVLLQVDSCYLVYHCNVRMTWASFVHTGSSTAISSCSCRSRI